MDRWIFGCFMPMSVRWSLLLLVGRALGLIRAPRSYRVSLWRLLCVYFIKPSPGPHRHSLIMYNTLLSPFSLSFLPLSAFYPQAASPMAHPHLIATVCLLLPSSFPTAPFSASTRFLHLALSRLLSLIRCSLSFDLPSLRKAADV
ncbi:hypothetical protein OF83DRAFT_555382 [Amylostereum chailletii]|nr:hypothetical protein OF83DRAFT_555382 [Amylostereum chailletii]